MIITPVKLVLFKSILIILILKEIFTLFLSILISARSEGFISSYEILEIVIALATVVIVVEKSEDNIVTSDKVGEVIIEKI